MATQSDNTVSPCEKDEFYLTKLEWDDIYMDGSPRLIN